jgi:hypothetical protein
MEVLRFLHCQTVGGKRVAKLAQCLAKEKLVDDFGFVIRIPKTLVDRANLALDLLTLNPPG